MNPEKTLKVTRFGEYSFEHGSGTLRKGADLIHLRPLAVRMLAVLLERPNEVVSRQQLREAIWGERVVEWEMGLHRLVKELREALHEDGRHPTFIHTVPKRGYRLLIRPDGDQMALETGAGVQRTKWFFAGALAFPVAFLVLCLYLGLVAQ